MTLGQRATRWWHRQVVAPGTLLLLGAAFLAGCAGDHCIGRVPIAAFVRHPDAIREYAHDRDTTVGGLSQGPDLAPGLVRTLIDMKKDWKVNYPFELAK